MVRSNTLTITVYGASQLTIESVEISADKTSVKVGETVTVYVKAKLNRKIEAGENPYGDCELYVNNRLEKRFTITGQEGGDTLEGSIQLVFEDEGTYMVYADVSLKFPSPPPGVA